MKVLFWVPYPTDGPSNRFRVEQYLPSLRQKGISYSIRPFWEKSAYKILYKNGHYLKKIYYFIKGSLHRLKDLIDLFEYDLVFVHREAYPIGGAFLEKVVTKKKPVIYDFDDSVFLPNSSSANKIVYLFKNHRKISKIIKISSTVIAGNNYLRDYALRYNKNVIVLPTSIDIDKYFFYHTLGRKSKIVIGWIGTSSTEQYLSIIRDAFVRLIKKYGSLIDIKLVGCNSNLLDVPGIRYSDWSLNTEIEDLQSFDIGIMPIWDDEWTKGKCAFKIIQYMSVGASVVASPIGVNKEIINDGINGFLAADEEEWFQKISLLIDNPDLRHNFSLQGRVTIEKGYSLKVTAPKFISILEKANLFVNK